jgi:acyl-CoA thioesterase FadM
MEFNTQTIRFTDYDRYLNLKTSSILRLGAQAAVNSTFLTRVRNGDKKILAFVKSQNIVRFKTNLEAMDVFELGREKSAVVEMTLIPYSHSNTRYTFLHELRWQANKQIFATATSHVVFVTMVNGKPTPSPLPEEYTKDMKWLINSSELGQEVITANNAFSIINLEKRRVPANYQLINIFTLLPRFTDEDVQNHVAQATYGDYFSDALMHAIGNCTPDHMFIDFVSELHGGEMADIYVYQYTVTSIVLVLVKKSDSNKKPICRALCTWNDEISLNTKNKRIKL